MDNNRTPKKRRNYIQINTLDVIDPCARNRKGG